MHNAYEVLTRETQLYDLRIKAWLIWVSVGRSRDRIHVFWPELNRTDGEDLGECIDYCVMMHGFDVVSFYYIFQSSLFPVLCRVTESIPDGSRSEGTMV